MSSWISIQSEDKKRALFVGTCVPIAERAILRVKFAAGKTQTSLPSKTHLAFQCAHPHHVRHCKLRQILLGLASPARPAQSACLCEATLIILVSHVSGIQLARVPRHSTVSACQPPPLQLCPAIFYPSSAKSPPPLYGNHSRRSEHSHHTNLRRAANLETESTSDRQEPLSKAVRLLHIHHCSVTMFAPSSITFVDGRKRNKVTVTRTYTGKRSRMMSRSRLCTSNNSGNRLNS